MLVEKQTALLGKSSEHYEIKSRNGLGSWSFSPSRQTDPECCFLSVQAQLQYCLTLEYELYRKLINRLLQSEKFITKRRRFFSRTFYLSGNFYISGQVKTCSWQMFFLFYFLFFHQKWCPSKCNVCNLFITFWIAFVLHPPHVVPLSFTSILPPAGMFWILTRPYFTLFLLVFKFWKDAFSVKYKNVHISC